MVLEHGRLPETITAVWERHWKLIVLAAFTVVAFTVYAATLGNPLVCDDYYWLALDRYHLFGAHELGRISALKWPFYADSPYYMRPLLLALWMVFTHFFGTASWPMHVLNVALQAGIAWLLFWFLTRLRVSKTASLIGALLFLLSPIAPEAVSWSSGNSDLVSFFFILLSLGMYAGFLGSGDRRQYVVSLAAMAAGLLSKETAFMLVLCIPALEILFAGRLRPRENLEAVTAGKRLKQFLARFVPFLGIFVVYMLFRALLIGLNFFVSSSPNKIIGSYFSARVLFAPLDSHEFDLRFITYMRVYTLVLLLASIAVMALRWRRISSIKKRVWAFLVFMFFAFLLPPGSFIAEGLDNDMWLSHFLYLPTAFLLAVIVFGLVECGSKKRAWMIISCAACLVLVPIYFRGVQVNNYHWDQASVAEDRILERIPGLLPDLPENATVYLRMREATRNSRVYWCQPMLEPPVRIKLGRFDLRVQQSAPDDPDAPDFSSTDDGYLIYYDENGDQLSLVHGPRA